MQAIVETLVCITDHIPLKKEGETVKVILINPPQVISSDAADGVTGDELRFFPEGLAAVAAALLRVGHEVSVVDLNHEPTTALERHADADVVGLTGMINHFAALEQLTSTIRSCIPRAMIVLGGPLISSDPSLIGRFLDFDIAVIGEGESAMVELLDNLDDPARVSGLAIRTAGGLLVTSPRRFIGPAECVPPAFSLFDLQWYLNGCLRPHQIALGITGEIVNNLTLTRGCPHHCRFCGRHILGNQVRSKPEHVVMEELETWQHAGAGAVRLQDDNVQGVPPATWRRVLSFFRDASWRWIANSRVDRVSREMLDEMQAHGCIAVAYGVESFSNEALANAGKGTTVARATQAITLTEDAGLKPIVFMIVGLPGETRESLRAAVRFVRRHQPLVIPYILCPLPGTEMFDFARNRIGDIHGFLRRCGQWESVQVAARRLYLNLTELPDRLLIDAYLELLECGGKDTRS